MKSSRLFFESPTALLENNAIQPDSSCSLLVQLYLCGEPEEWSAAIQSFLSCYFPNATAMGMTSFALYRESAIHRQGLAVHVTYFEDVGFKQAYFDHKTPVSQLQMMLKQLLSDSTQVLLIYSASRDELNPELLPIISQLRQDIKVAGAIACPSVKTQTSRIYCRSGCYQAGTIITAIDSSNLEAKVLVKQNWFAIGKPLIVNSAQGKEVAEIDGVSVVNLYERYLGPTVVKYLPAASSLFPLWIDDGVHQSTSFVVKRLPKGGALFSNPMPQGQLVRLAFADMNSLLENQYVEEAGRVNAEVAMVFSCGARLELLKESIDAELKPLNERLPVSTCFGFGEIASDASSVVKLHSHSMVVLLLAQRDAQISFKEPLAPEPERSDFQLTNGQLLKIYNNLTRALMADLTASNHALLQLSQQDHLTGLANRHFLDKQLDLHYKNYQRYGTRLNLLMLDIDHFKRINDKYGHINGDKVLQEVAAILNTQCRQLDVVGRWGGEEFLIICPGCEEREAVAVAARIRQAVEGLTVTFQEGDVCLTVSIGVASLQPEQRVDDLLRYVDAKLYQAKSSGRNRVVF